MTEKTAQRDQFNWRLPVAALLGTPLIFLIVAISQSESLVYLFLVVPIISVVLIVLAVYSAIARKKGRCVPILSMLAIFWVLSVPLFKNYLAIRSAGRWLIWSNDYKAQVMAQPNPSNGNLKHLNWDGWGWGGENTEVYLVFDPSDSLSAAAKIHQPGKFSGFAFQGALLFCLGSNWVGGRVFS